MSHDLLSFFHYNFVSNNIILVLFSVECFVCKFCINIIQMKIRNIIWLFSVRTTSVTMPQRIFFWVVWDFLFLQVELILMKFEKLMENKCFLEVCGRNAEYWREMGRLDCDLVHMKRPVNSWWTWESCGNVEIL